MPRARRLSTIEPACPAPIWNGRIFRGELTELAGDAGVGKSTLLSSVCAPITAGNPLPADDADPPIDGGVVWVTREESGEQMRLRLEAMGADLERVAVIDDEGDGIDLRRDLPQIIEEAEAVDAALIIVDTLLRCLPGVPAGDYQRTDEALRPLLRYLRETSRGCVLNNHVSKTGSKAKHRALGSVGITALARSVLFAGVDPTRDGPFRFALASAKCNLASPATLPYRTFEAPGGVILCEWGDADPTITADAVASATEESRDAVAAAKAAILAVLQPRPCPAKSLVELIKEHDSLISKAAILRARAILAKQGQILRHRVQKDTGYVLWYLPRQSSTVVALLQDRVLPASAVYRDEDSDDGSDGDADSDATMPI